MIFRSRRVLVIAVSTLVCGSLLPACGPGEEQINVSASKQLAEEKGLKRSAPPETDPKKRVPRPKGEVEPTRRAGRG